MNIEAYVKLLNGSAWSSPFWSSGQKYINGLTRVSLFTSWVTKNEPNLISYGLCCPNGQPNSYFNIIGLII